MRIIFSTLTLILGSLIPLWSQATLTQPTAGLGGGLLQWTGFPMEAGSPQGITVGLGMWRHSPQRVEWTTGLDYQRLQGRLSVYQGINQGERVEVDWVSHRLHWTTLAVVHLQKPYLNLQVGGFVGVGLGGKVDQAAFLDQAARLPASLLSQRGNFSYGPILGLGGGTEVIQVHLRYLWDAYDYLPPAGLTLRWSLLSLGFTVIIPGIEVY